MIIRARLLILVGILASLTCIAYLQLLEFGAFSSDYLAPIFRFLMTRYDAQTAWVSLLVCLVACAWSNAAPILRAVDGLASRPQWVAASTAVAVALGSRTVYHNYPLSMDEYAAVFQAKIFAAGKMTTALPPSVVDWLILPHFNGMFLVASRQTGQAMEAYWPGFSLLLAPFEMVGASWACNALLAGLSIYLVYLITREITGDRRAAGWAMLFAVGSSEFLANSISYYSTQAHMTANLLFAWLLIKPTPLRALGAGLAGSLALVLHNPLPHLLFGAPWVLFMLTERSRRRHLLPLLLGYIPGVAVALAWLWLRTTTSSGNQLLSTFGAGLEGVFSFPDLVLMNMRAASTVKLWIWAIPCLYLFAVSGYLRYRSKEPVRLLAQSALLTFAAYFFVRLDQGHGWGFRYFHSAWGTIPILAGCAMSNTALDERLVSFAGAVAMFSLLVLVPFQMIQIDSFISRQLAQIPSPRPSGGNIYFLTGNGGFYMDDLIQIDPFLRQRNLILASRGTKLDGELVRQNWPRAVLGSNGPWGQQWYLEGSDGNQAASSVSHDDRFVLTFDASKSVRR